MSKSKHTRVVWDVTKDIFCIETTKTHTSIIFDRLFDDNDLTNRLGLITNRQGNTIDPAIWFYIAKYAYKNTMNIVVFSPTEDNHMEMVSVEKS